MKIREFHLRSGLLVALAVAAVLLAMTVVVNRQIQLRMDEVLVRHGAGDPEFSDIDRIYSEVADEGRAFAARVAARDLSLPETEAWLSDELRKIRRLHPEVVATVFACEREDRMLLARVAPTGGITVIRGGGYRKRGWYRDAILSGHATWHEPFLGDFIKDPIAVFATPFSAADGRPAGVACVDISLGFMGRSFAQRFQTVFLLVVTGGIALVALLVVPYMLRFQRERMRLAIERRRMNEDLAMAKSIQTGALPNVFPPYPQLADRFDLYATMRTAREVGGDFYDFYFVAPDKLALIIADVSGKGVPAAMFMMRAKTMIKACIESVPGDLAAGVAAAGDRLSEGNDRTLFVTAWVGVVDIGTGCLEFVNAGHNPPLVRRADGTVEWLRARSGVPLAALAGARYRSQAVDLSVGDALLLYTDGVTEAANGANELFGESRLERFLADASVSDGRALFDGLMSAVDRFAAGAEQADDITGLFFGRLK